MENVIAAVNLFECQEKAIIPFHYIHKLKACDAFNRSFSRKKTYKVFWSNDFEKNPNFDLPVSQEFHSLEDACFRAKIFRTFGNFQILIDITIYTIIQEYL